MNDILQLIIVIAIAIAGFTILYKTLPYRTWQATRQPYFTLFPKYQAKFDKPISDIESALEKLQFKKTADHIYTRGKIYGDFSAHSIKLTVTIDEKHNQIKVRASFFGILFDTGDIWQVTSDIAN